MSEKRAIHCQVQLTEKANDKLETFQNRLRERNIKLSKADIINLVLSNMTMADFDKAVYIIRGFSQSSRKGHEDLRKLGYDQRRSGRYSKTPRLSIMAP